MRESDWDLLVERIRDKKCTPFLGAGTCHPTLPLGSEVAKAWAGELGYPLIGNADLPHVAQFIGVNKDPMAPKDKMIKELKRSVQQNGYPDFKDAAEPHALLADLSLPIYLTTNYDDFMVAALRAKEKEPMKEFCRWNKHVRRKPSIFDSTTGYYEPTPANPLVYHLHGHWDTLGSIVLTEDDYLDFLFNLSREEELIPPLIKDAMTDASLLFIGYSFMDWDFRVLYHGIISNLDKSQWRISVTVQLSPKVEEAIDPQKAVDYLEQYFGRMNLSVYWGTAREFARDLRERWDR